MWKEVLEFHINEKVLEGRMRKVFLEMSLPKYVKCLDILRVVKIKNHILPSELRLYKIMQFRALFASSFCIKLRFS